VIHPGSRYQPPEIEIFGQLAVILKLSEAAATQESQGAMVAGARNKRPLRLPALRFVA